MSRKKLLSPLKRLCLSQQLTTLMDVFCAVSGTGGDEIIMSDELISSSRKCIDEMLRLGK